MIGSRGCMAGVQEMAGKRIMFFFLFFLDMLLLNKLSALFCILFKFDNLFDFATRAILIVVHI